MKTPKALSRWFLVHFAADVLVATPLLVAPRGFLGALGWHSIDPVAARLVAAALFGIGIASVRMHRAPLHAFPHVLELKIIWSAAAIIGFVWSLLEGVHGNPWSVWLFLAVFVAFNTLWVIWLVRVRRALSGS